MAWRRMRQVPREYLQFLPRGYAPIQQQLFIYSARRMFGNLIKANHPETSDWLDGPVESVGVMYSFCDPELPDIGEILGGVVENIWISGGRVWWRQ
jgi:hypothetical protein